MGEGIASQKHTSLLPKDACTPGGARVAENQRNDSFDDPNPVDLCCIINSELPPAQCAGSPLEQDLAASFCDGEALTCGQ